MRSEIPLHVETMGKRNVKLKDGCIYIPLRLVDHFEPDITLKDHEDKIHGVRARKHDADQIILESGWGEFVFKQRIQENDLIVFKKGKPHIEVFILEKTSSSFLTGNYSCAQEVIELSSSDDDEIMAKKMASVSSPCAKSEYGAPKLNEVGSKPPRSNIFMGPSQRRRYILSQGKVLKGLLREKVEEKVQAICSEFSVFVKVMNKSSRSRREIHPLHFCLEYASECLPAEQKGLLLLLEGDEREWTGKLDISRNGSRKGRFIFGAWKDFLWQVGLKEGDICLFELVDKSAGWITMKVHLIRRSEIQP
ncbi:unnamed protein product [Triticum turgidum subsp. durum]|uniref:TF-B3 domain-containing protein n=1 Tax=Triticum turgidum subsp. durum TaxID=4567 RepID=A0A9R1B4F0_TRITD|nr:unnamed protein product [Triticum turgidum subsp. durum]